MPNPTGKKRVRGYTRAMYEIYKQYGLKEPTTAEKLEAVRDENNLTSSQKSALLNMFRQDASDLELAASIQLKLRKTPIGRLTLKLFDKNERKILERLLPGQAPLKEKASNAELYRLKKELIEKYQLINGGKNEKISIFMGALALYNKGKCGIETLRDAVREKKESEVLLEFMGKVPGHQVLFFSDRGLTCGKDINNGDSFLSADIHEHGKTKRLDAVFDGVGESDDASSASKTAAEVFKLGLMLKSPKTAEDLEMLMTMADLAIFTSRCQEVGLISSSTTAVAFLSDAKNAIACHAGDSNWMIFRDNKLNGMSRDHSIAEKLRKEGLTCPKELLSAITSALGVGFSHLESHKLKLKKGDAVLLCTGGISDTVNTDEIEVILSEDSEIGISESRIFVFAVQRDDYEKTYPTITGDSIQGKLDDKTIILYRIE